MKLNPLFAITEALGGEEAWTVEQICERIRERQLVIDQHNADYAELRKQYGIAHELIESLQRENAALKGEKCPICGGNGCSNCDIHLARAQNAALRKAIADAPHTTLCNSNYPCCAQCGNQATQDSRGGWDCLIGVCGSVPVYTPPCTCWKSAALSAPAAAGDAAPKEGQ